VRLKCVFVSGCVKLILDIVIASYVDREPSLTFPGVAAIAATLPLLWL